MKAHEGTSIVTSAPLPHVGRPIGVRVYAPRRTAGLWTFAAVDHWNAECVGWHDVHTVGPHTFCRPRAASRKGSGDSYGSVEADVARGLAAAACASTAASICRTTSSSQIRVRRGIHPSFSFVEEPETRRRRRCAGIALLKEQAVYGSGLSHNGRIARPVRASRRCKFVEQLLGPVPLATLEKAKAYRTAHLKPASNTSYAMPT